MTGILIGSALVAVISGLVIYTATKPNNGKVDIYEDFKVIKRALSEFNKANLTGIKSISELNKYIEKDVSINLLNYELTSDQKFLIVNKANEISHRDQLIEKIGGSSYYNDVEKKLYLALYKFKLSKVEPVAVITYFPKDNITTTTKLEWNHNQSIADNKDYKNVEWKNKKERYSKIGTYTIEMRIQDRNDNWSDWASVEIEVNEEKGIKGMACSAGTLFRIHNSGKVDAFGKNQYGQIGDGTLNDYDKLQRVVGVENVAQISGGDTHTLFKANDGIAYSCGNNDYGQLGIGTRNHSKSPQKIWGLEQVKQVVAGPDYSAAILASGAVLTWGNNEFGQLGDEGVKFKELPKRVKDVSKVKQISLSSTHVTCVLHDGTVVSWGDNSHGQLGTGFKGKATPPTVSNITGAFYAATGKNFTIIVLDTGKVKCFGHNNNGQLGMDSETDVMFAKEIPGLKSIVKVVASETFVVAMTDIGEVWTWGRYSSKEGETYYKPQKIEGLKYVKDIGVTTNRGFALLEDGSIVKWNGNIDFVEKVETKSIAE